MKYPTLSKSELQKEAETYVKNAGIITPPINPNIWCQNKDEIKVYELDLQGECDGLLRFKNKRFHLFYDISSDKWRFNFAHEVAHFLIDEHHHAIRLGNEEHYSKVRFISSKTMEREADWFAAGLLMPEFLFKPRCPDPNFKDIGEIAELFNVSLTSAILRTIDFSPICSAVFITQNGKLQWYYASEDMAFLGITCGKKGCPPPRRSKTFEISVQLDSYNGLPCGGEGWVSDWFSQKGEDIALWEQVLPLPRYNMLITLLTIDMPDED